VGQLCTQLSEWQLVGLVVPEKITRAASEAVRCLGQAACGQEDSRASAAAAEQAIRSALDAGELLAATYADQAMAVRHRESPKLPTLLSGDLGVALLDDAVGRPFLEAFNAAMLPFCWREIEASEGSRRWLACDRQIEWCRTHRLKVLGGPLPQMDPRSLPDWLYLWEGDFENLMSFSGEFIRETVTRYRGKVDIWLCAGRANSAQLLGLSEEEKLRLAANSLEAIRSIDAETPAMLCLDQPWAEYTTARAVDFPPLHFADAMIRAGLNPAGLMLELNWGYHPGGTLPRTPLELSRQLDYWAILGLPLYVSVAAPSGRGADPMARQRVESLPDDATPATQQSWAARYIPVLLAKPFIAGIIWSQLRDTEPHDFPHGGLFDLDRRAKPVLGTLTSIRRAHLQ
jgi:hypothetical protein